MTRLNTLALLLVVALTGCMTSAQRLNPEVVDRVQPGMRRAEVEKILGKAMGEANSSSQRTLVNYDYIRFNPNSRVQSQSVLPNEVGTVMIRTVSILYGKDDRVQKYTYSETSRPFQQQMNTYSVGDLFTEEDLAEIIKGASTMGDVERVLGPPMFKTLNLHGNLCLGWFYSSMQGRFSVRQRKQTVLVLFDNLGIAQDYIVMGDAGVKGDG